jgi:hypothetical protein
MFCAPRIFFGGTESVGSRFNVLRSRTRFRRYRGRRVPFSCFELPDSFSTVSRASRFVFMFCASVVVFGGTEDIPSHFYVSRSWTCFRRYRGRRVPFSCFVQPESFSAVPSASGPVNLFCAPGHLFGVTERVGSRFHVFPSRTRFRRYRGRQVPFSCFALPDSFSTVPRVSCRVFLFCAYGLIFGGI